MADGLQSLASLPEGVSHANEMIAALDEAFLVGFGRLGAEQLRALDAVGRAFTGTPLAARLTEALGAVRRSEFLDKHFLAIAAARSALQGAQHDALLAQCATALGREMPATAPGTETDVQATASHHEVFLESARQWLMEVALAGLLQLSADTVLPFLATLEKLQGEPTLMRPGSLLTGFVNELLAAVPVSAMPEVPAFRWVDLWSRAMVLCAKVPAPIAREKVSGTLCVFGADVRQHDNVANLVVHGLLIEGAGARAVRVNVSVYKVDLVSGGEMWRLFQQAAPKLVGAVAEMKDVALTAMTLLGSGDLVWNESQAKLGNNTDLLANVTKWLAPGSALKASALAGADRHPTQIAVPVLFAECKGAGTEESPAVQTADGAKIPLALARMEGSRADFDAADVRKSSNVVGLLRFDSNAWSLQPLALIARGAKKAEVFVAGGKYAGASLVKEGRDAAMPVLKERAGRLLRAK